MGLLSKAIKYTWRYLRYGKQVGKTAENGTKVYRRAGTTTAVDASGKVVHSAKTVKTGPYSTRTTVNKPLPFGGTQKTEIYHDWENGSHGWTRWQYDRFGTMKGNTAQQMGHVYGSPEEGFVGYIDDLTSKSVRTNISTPPTK